LVGSDVVVILMSAVGYPSEQLIRQSCWASTRPGTPSPHQWRSRLVCFRSPPLPREACATICADLPQHERALAASTFILVGMMGAGRAPSGAPWRSSGYRFVDCPTVWRQARDDDSQTVQTDGEAGFRSLRTPYSRAISRLASLVVATAGGSWLLCEPETGGSCNRGWVVGWMHRLPLVLERSERRSPAPLDSEGPDERHEPGGEVMAQRPARSIMPRELQIQQEARRLGAVGKGAYGVAPACSKTRLRERGWAPDARRTMNGQQGAPASQFAGCVGQVGGPVVGKGNP